MKEMGKKIVYKSLGVLLSAAMLCGCGAQGNMGNIGGDAGTSASSIEITIKDMYGYRAGDKLGSDLNFEACMVITEDLIAEYGVDSIVSSSGSFEEDFGMTSDEYIQNYLDNKLYMHFIED